jgi:hypothetical protein
VSSGKCSGPVRSCMQRPSSWRRWRRPSPNEDGQLRDEGDDAEKERRTGAAGLHAAGPPEDLQTRTRSGGR